MFAAILCLMCEQRVLCWQLKSLACATAFNVLSLLLLLLFVAIRGHIVASTTSSPLRHVPVMFTARRIQHFLPSSTRVEVCLPTVQWARPTVAVI